jgi:hypothetical protein
MPDYRITLKVVFEYTYEKEEADEELGDGIAQPCDDESCLCDGNEAPLTPAEVDTFMCETYCGQPRYHWYATMLMNMTIRDVTYDAGTLSFTVTSDMSAKKLKRFIVERDFYQCFFEGSPGNEGLVPTRHQYGYTPLCTLRLEHDYGQLGYIECRNSETVTVLRAVEDAGL